MDKPATLEAVASLSPSHNAAMGALVGAACGDAAGAVLEFMHPPPTEDDVEQALAFPGGGCWNVGPGQITDDVELVLAQADGLLAGRGALNTTGLAAAYHAWYSSSPFDVGMATRGAFGKPGSGEETAKRSVDLNAKSQANGALMRATPLGVWAHRLTPAEAFAAGVADAKCVPSLARSSRDFVLGLTRFLRLPPQVVPPQRVRLRLQRRVRRGARAPRGASRRFGRRPRRGGDSAVRLSGVYGGCWVAVRLRHGRPRRAL